MPFMVINPKKEKKRTLIKSHAWTIYKLWAFSNGLFQLIEVFEWTQIVDYFRVLKNGSFNLIFLGKLEQMVF